MITKITKQEMIKGLRQHAPLRSVGSWNKESLKNIKEDYDRGVELGLIKPNITISFNKHDLLMIRGTLRMLSEDDSQTLIKKEEALRLIKVLGGNI